MEFYVIYGKKWENLQIFHSGRKAKAFFQEINKAGEEGGLFFHRPGRPCLAWETLGYTEIFKKKYR